MENLGLSAAPQPATAYPPVQPAGPKSPGLAWLLSVLLPGLGQLYLGKIKRGVVTLLFTAGGITGFVVMSQQEGTGETFDMFFGYLLRLVIVLYIFGSLDAYFTAAEINSGEEARMQYNPRVGATLNVLTYGLGYWYLDEKYKAWGLFVLLRVLTKVGQKNPGTVGDAIGVAIELILIGLAIDAYRLAKKKNSAAEEAPLVPADLRPEAGLPKSIPVAFAGLLFVGYFTLVAVGFVMPDYTTIDQSTSRVTEESNYKVYSNPKYGITVRVPAAWTITPPDKDEFLAANLDDGVCSVVFMAEETLPMLPLQSHFDSLIEAFSKEKIEFVGRSTTSLGSVPAEQLSFSKTFTEGTVEQQHVVAQKGLSIYSLVLTRAGDAPCSRDFSDLRTNVVLP